MTAAALARDPSQSDRSVAKALGVSPTTVGTERANVQSGHKPDRKEASGRKARGEWSALFDDGKVPLSIRSAQRLMAIAEHPTLSKATHVSLLPSSWGTLYELSKLPESVLEAALDDVSAHRKFAADCGAVLSIEGA